MKPQSTGLKAVDILGNAHSSSPQELLTAAVRQWRRRLGYCTVFATVPAIMVSTVDGARSGASQPPERSVAVERARRQRLNWNRSNSALLRRQSQFLLPHQRTNVEDLKTPEQAGADGCPGRSVPSGVYTAGSPYADSGDTTGANSTVNRIHYYYYYNVDAFGSDHVYTFSLSALGANPEIRVSRTTGSLEPLIYIIPAGFGFRCPQGISNPADVWTYQTSNANGVATISGDFVRNLPLNVPLYLFIDSQGATNAGPYTLRIQDVTIGPECNSANPVECAEFFVVQQYRDFLGREPDATGFQNWVNTLRNCPNGGFGEFDNPQCDRVHVSSGFFLSEEFRGRGYWAYRFFEVGLDRRPSHSEFTSDLYRVGGSQSPQQELASKINYTNEFVTRADFRARYDSLSNAAYVNTLEANAEVTLPNKQDLVNALNGGTKTRSTVLREIVESQAVHDRFFTRAFVAMQYYGYLQRDPDQIGFQNWVNTLNADPSNFRHMIFGFIYSTEYRARFGP